MDLWPAIEAGLRTRPAGIDEAVADLPAHVEPPAELWHRVAARLDTAPDAAAPGVRYRGLWWPATGIAAALVLAAILVARQLAPDPSDAVPAPQHAADGAPWWLTGPFVFDPREPAAADATLTGVARALSRELELVRGERKAIENAMQRHVDDPDLRALWQHTYQAELVLTGESERVIADYHRGDDL